MRLRLHGNEDAVLFAALIISLVVCLFLLPGCRTADAPEVEPVAKLRQVNVGRDLVIEQHYHIERHGGTRQDAGKSLSDLGARVDANAAASQNGDASQRTTAEETHAPAVNPAPDAAPVATAPEATPTDAAE